MAGAAGRVPAGNQTDKVPCKIASVIQININGFPAWALIDSGADQSMVNENFASRAVGRDKLHQAHVERMTGAGGVPLKPAAHYVTFGGRFRDLRNSAAAFRACRRRKSYDSAETAKTAAELYDSVAVSASAVAESRRGITQMRNRPPNVT